MDSIHIQGIRCYGYTGLLVEEQALGQWFEVDVTLWLDLSQPGLSDRIEDTLDYRKVIHAVKTITQTQTFALLERLAGEIAEAILAIGWAEKVDLHATKVAPPIPDFGGRITVALSRVAKSTKT
jgi:7,8-dihydroneopterin aldolase/epimerase/oxygenase